MAGTKSYTGKKGTPAIGGTSAMKAGLGGAEPIEPGANEPENKEVSGRDGLPSHDMSKVGEIEAKHGVLGAKDQGVDVENEAAAKAPFSTDKRVAVRQLFGDALGDQVDTFVKRNGQDVAATEENYSKLARMAAKLLEDKRREGVALEDGRYGLGAGTAWDNRAHGDAAQEDEGEDKTGIGSSSAMRTPEEIDADYRRVFGKSRAEVEEELRKEDLGKTPNKETMKEAAKAASEKDTSIWSQLRRLWWGESADEANKRNADERNAQDPDSEFDWNDYHAEMKKIAQMEKSNLGLNLAEPGGTTGVKIGNAVLGFLHNLGRTLLGKEHEYDTPDDVYVNSPARERMERLLSRNDSGFFTNTNRKKFQYEFGHIDRVDEDGNVIVYDADNEDYPNAYPDVESDFSKGMADMGLSADTIIDVGAYSPEGNRDLYWQGRELLLAMSDFDPQLLSSLKSVRLMTREQFMRAADENSPNHDVYDKELLDGRASAFVDGHLVVFVDPTSETDETELSGRLHPPPEELRVRYHQALSEVVMAGATPEFRKEWEKVSLLKENTDGLFSGDPQHLKTFVDAFSGVADVEKTLDPEQKKYLEDQFSYGYPNRDQEMAAAIDMYKNPRLPEILFKLRHDNPQAYAYLTRMLAVVDRFEEQLAPKQKNRPRFARPGFVRPKPEAKKMSAQEAAAISAKARAMDEMAARLAKEQPEGETGGDTPESVTPPSAPKPPKAPGAAGLFWDDEEAPEEPPQKPEPAKPAPKKPAPKPPVRPAPAKPAPPKPQSRPTPSKKPAGGAGASVNIQSSVRSMGTIGNVAAQRLAEAGIRTVGEFIDAIIKKDPVAHRVLGSPRSKTGKTRRTVLWEMIQVERGMTAEEAASALGYAYRGKGDNATIDWEALDKEWDNEFGK